jgi:hypothetical protein
VIFSSSEEFFGIGLKAGLKMKKETTDLPMRLKEK